MPFLRTAVLSVGLMVGCLSGTSALAGKYIETGESFDTIEELLEICRAATPEVTLAADLVKKFGTPHIQPKKTPKRGRTWYMWQAGDPVVDILVWWDAKSGIIEAASGKYHTYSRGEWLWANTKNIPVAKRCALKSTPVQN